MPIYIVTMAVRAYPYTLANYMTITSSSATTNPGTYYYYFYDIEVRDPQCISATDTVIVTPVVVDFGYVVNGNAVAFSDSSVSATGWLWDFGDGGTSSLQNPNHTYASSGTYTVTLTINGAGCSKSYVVTIGTTGLDVLAGNNLQFTLFPNPARKQTTLQLNQKLLQPANLILYTLEGKEVISMRVNAGVKEVIIPVNELAAQLYVVVLRNEEGEVRQKLFVE
jgi:PKD repeat protein